MLYVIYGLGEWGSGERVVRERGIVVAALTMAAWLTGPEFSVILCSQGRPGRRCCRAVLLTHMYTDRDPFPPPQNTQAKQIVKDPAH